MASSLETLHTQLEPYLYERGTLHYREGSGREPGDSLRGLRLRYRALTSPEAFHTVRDAQGGTTREEGGPRRQRRLLEFLASEVEERFSADAVDAIATLEERGTVPLGPSGEETQSFHRAVARLPRDTSRQKRNALENALGRFLYENTSPYARRVEATARTAEVLGFPSYLALREEVSGLALSPLLAESTSVLSRTEDAYRDVLGYVLKKVDATVRPMPNGDAREHDLLHAAYTPSVASCFRWEELLPAVARWLTDLGLSPDAERRIRLDPEARDGKSARTFVAALRVPDEVRLVVFPESGLGSFSALLQGYGKAQHLARIRSTEAVEDRRLLEASVSEGYAALFDHVLLDEGWLRRYLRLPQALSREVARVAAFHQTALLRRSVAKLGYELSLYAHGAGEDRADEYEERLRKALFVGVHRGFYLREVEPRLYTARLLRGWALEARLNGLLLERFNEDWWRNPGAGAFLASLFARGGRDDAPALCQELNGKPPSFDEVSTRLVRVLGA